MTESTVSPASITAREAKTIIFDNHLPLRTRQDIREIWLGYAYLDFGGNYFRWCRCSREAGKYHCWHRHNSPYTEGRNYATYLGLFGNYDEVVSLLDRYGHETRGKILAQLAESYGDGEPGEIELPEC